MGNKYIIAFVNWYSGRPEAFAVPDKTAETVAHIIIEEVYLRFACPLELVTDNGSENVNRIIKETLNTLNIHHITTSYYHPGSNIKVERFHRTLHDILAKCLQDAQDIWDLHLNQVLAVVRFIVSESEIEDPRKKPVDLAHCEQKHFEDEDNIPKMELPKCIWECELRESRKCICI